MNRAQSPQVRILVAILFSLFCWLFVGLSLPAVEGGLLSAYLMANLPFISLAIALLLSVKFLIARPLKTLITDQRDFQWRRFGYAFLLYSASALFFLLIGALRNPTTIGYNPAHPISRLLFFVVAMVITPIQTSSEELLFRILPVRLFYPKKLRANLLLALVSALLFTLPHLSNQELALSANKAPIVMYYALFGFGVTAISLASGGFEIALAVHAANNLHVALICNYHTSSLPSVPFFFSSRPVGSWWEPVQLIFSLTIVGAYTLLDQRRNQRHLPHA